ncbi:MAG TPA: tripartite tricarboxylate transporter substrate binding protein [Burkholderiales bacterium]|nr:tripartite tricarboxylate transporter substrate binding protein [Burkholderiales bacterium]
MRNTTAIFCVLSLVAAIAAGNARAQANYPAKPIRLIVPLAPGGPSDILARAMAQKMTEGLKQTVVVDNRTGAGGTIGTDIAAKSPADGYTLLLIAAATYTVNANIYSKLPYDPRKDLIPVSILAAAPYVLTVHPALPVKTFKEFLALAKARPGQLNYGSGGTGTGPQMAFELLKLRTGMDIVHIPYKGTGPAMTEQLAGQVQVGLFNLIASMQVVQSGRLRGIVVTGEKRSSRLPDIPTLGELGIAGFEDVGGHAMWLPAGVPKEIVTRLHQEMVRAVQSPEVKSRLEAEGAEIIANTPEQALASIRADLDKWAEVVRKTGIKAN